MNWLFYTLASVVLYTVMSLVQKVVADKSESYRASGFIFNSFATLITLIIFLLQHSFGDLLLLPKDLSAWLFLILGGLFYGLFERGRYQATQLLDASVFATILTLGTLTAFIGSSLLYHEPITLYKLIGVSSIIGALVLVAGGEKKSQPLVSRKGLIVGVVVSVSMGLGWMLDKMGSRYFTASIYSVFIWAAGLPFIFFPSINMGELKKELFGSWKGLLLLASLNSVAYLCQLQAVTIAESTKVIPIIQTTTLLTVLLGIVILKERDNISKKILAAVIALVGTYFLL